MTLPSLIYSVPVTIVKDGESIPGTLTVARRVDGKFWEGRLSSLPDLYLSMNQIATPRTGGFGHLSHGDFLHHVRLVFDFSGGVHFDFAGNDFRPVTAGFGVSLGEPWRLH